MDDERVPRLDPRDGICDGSIHVNPVAKLTLVMSGSPYGTDGFHVHWSATLWYKPSVTPENAFERVSREKYGWQFYCLDGATKLLKPYISSRYPQDNLWQFIIGNMIQTIGHPPRDLFDPPLEGPYEAEELYRYCMDAMILLMQTKNGQLWPSGDFRLFVPVDHAERLEGEFGERLTMNMALEKRREFCEVTYRPG